MKKCTEYTLGKTVVYQGYDPNPDTSYLGEYGEKYKPGCVIRGDRTIYEDHLDDDEYDPPTMDREYSFFYPPDNGEKPGTPEYRKYALQDYENMESLNNNQWRFVGITVKTEVIAHIPNINGTGKYTEICDHIVSSLWGIEDHFNKDSTDYHIEVIADLKSENKTKLLKMGFSEEEINESLNNAEEVD